MDTPSEKQTRRSVLKQSAALGAATVGLTGVTTATRPGEVSGKVTGTREDPVTESDIRKVHAEVRREFQRTFGESLRLARQPTSVEDEVLVAYGITVNPDETTDLYYGFVPKDTDGSETAQRHNAAERFVDPSRVDTLDSDFDVVTNSFSKFKRKFVEGGGCDEGAVTLESIIYQHETDDSLWSMASNGAIIPGTNECNSFSVTQFSEMNHDWGYSFADDPTIVDRGPTGVKDGSKSFDITAGVSTTGASGEITVGYTQPDVEFRSKGSTERTRATHEYNTSSDEITWDKEHVSSCEYDEDPGLYDTLGLSSLEAEYTGGTVQANSSFRLD